MKKIKIALLILMILFLQGCSQHNSSSKMPNVGFKGLEVIYSDNLKELYEYEVANIKIYLGNEGFHNINKGILKISVEENYLDLVNSKKYFELKGGTLEFPEGESTNVIFSINTKELEKNSIERITDFHITSCYDYGSEFSVDICIDSDIYGNNENKICAPKSQKLTKGQGGPVTISEVETRMKYDEAQDRILPSFIITVKNQGDGTVIKKNKIDEVCSSEGVDNDDFNIVNLEVKISESGQLTPLVCSQNFVKLRGGEKKITCTYEQGLNMDTGTYYTPLNINLKYGYMKVISKKIKIKKINT